MTNLEQIIFNINNHGTKLFDIFNLTGVEKIFKSLQSDLVYLGHGVQSICFKRNTNHVIKFCSKRKCNSITCNSTTLINASNDLIKLDFPILAPTAVLYEDNHWIVFEQPWCKPLSDVSIRFGYFIVQLLIKMLTHNKRISDVYFKNFGLMQNKLLMFDYNELDTFSESSSNFLITNLFTIFNLIGRQLNWPALSGTSTFHWSDVEKYQFGKHIFPDDITLLLISLNNRDINPAIKHAQVSAEFFHSQILSKCVLSSVNALNDQLIMTVSYTCEIYGNIFNHIKMYNIQSIYDLHPSSTGLGYKLAQDFPYIDVYIGHNTDNYYLLSMMIDNLMLSNTLMVPNPVPKADLVILGNICIPEGNKISEGNKITDGTGRMSEIFKKSVRPYISKYGLFEIPIIDNLTILSIRDLLHLMGIKVHCCWCKSNKSNKYLFWCGL